MPLRILALLCALACAALPVQAQEPDADGAKDHPMVSRFPGYYISGYDAQEFGVYEFTLPTDATRRVEGRYWEITYDLREGARKGGPLEIGRNYANLFTARGGAKLLEDLDTGGGTLTARMPAGGRNIWLEVSVSNSGEVYTLTIVEESGMAQQVEFTAMELSRILTEKGSVALHGILFDTGQATIRPESAAALAPVGELLTKETALRLEIQGHTDNVGAAPFNQRLSEVRAAAVKAYLVSTFSIAADRLTTVGLGDAKPIGDNTTEEGRAQNRRVALVKR